MPDLADTTKRLIERILMSGHKLAMFDPRIEPVVNTIVRHPNIIWAEDLGDSCFSISSETKTLMFNQSSILKIWDCVPPEFAEEMLFSFIIHELNHLSQGFRDFKDVSKLKQISGSSKMAHFDLQSDFISAHMLSLLQTFEERGMYCQETYRDHLHHIWCEIGNFSVGIFPTDRDRGKQQRVLGWALTSNVIATSNANKSLLELDSELWPEWSEDLDLLVVYGRNGKIWRSPSHIDTSLMKELLNSISLGCCQDILSLSSKLISCN